MKYSLYIVNFMILNLLSEMFPLGGPISKLYIIKLSDGVWMGLVF